MVYGCQGFNGLGFCCFVQDGRHGKAWGIAHKDGQYLLIQRKINVEFDKDVLSSCLMFESSNLVCEAQEQLKSKDLIELWLDKLCNFVMQVKMRNEKNLFLLLTILGLVMCF